MHMVKNIVLHEMIIFSWYVDLQDILYDTLMFISSNLTQVSQKYHNEGENFERKVFNQDAKTLKFILLLKF
ncbi:hypothetical protein T4D_5195 [Trichinella pseudospiralis]|uniref:Uncharacterized protein n=1 Tax=Trichinella pseudospiralis TaxID=6337 RepID=A0A0V1FQ80_TRIPS|nr:hypothetical protein T4D_5195 [Trichinella pseudospiralis]